MNGKILAGFIGGMVWAVGGMTADRVVYRETFDGGRNPAQVLRIAQGVERWEVVREKEGEGAFLRVHARPTAARPEFLVVWDLAPLQFRRLRVEIRPNGIGAEAGLQVVANLEDRAGVAYAGRPWAGGPEGQAGRGLVAGEWNLVSLRLPEDLLGASRGGKALLSPTGEPLGPEPNFTNLGIRTIYFNFRLPPNSPWLGTAFTVDLRHLTLTEMGP